MELDPQRLPGASQSKDHSQALESSTLRESESAGLVILYFVLGVMSGFCGLIIGLLVAICVLDSTSPKRRIAFLLGVTIGFLGLIGLIAGIAVSQSN